MENCDCQFLTNFNFGLQSSSNQPEESLGLSGMLPSIPDNTPLDASTPLRPPRRLRECPLELSQINVPVEDSDYPTETHSMLRSETTEFVSVNLDAPESDSEA